MKILTLKLKSKNNSNVFTVETEAGEYLLHSDIIVTHGIKLGEIENAIFFDAVDRSQSMIGYNLVLKYIGAKVKTEKQIRDYLYRKEFKANTIDEIIEKLKEYKIIDDKVYAEIYVRSNPNFSRRKLKMKLAGGGVKSDIIQESVEDIDDFESGMKHAEKFFRQKEVNKENIEKLIRRLTYLGYTWETIQKILNQLKYEVE